MSVTTRREFFGLAAGAAGFFSWDHAWAQTPSPYDLVAATDRTRILESANRHLSEQPVTVTASHSPRAMRNRPPRFSTPRIYFRLPIYPNWMR